MSMIKIPMLVVAWKFTPFSGVGLASVKVVYLAML